MRYANNTRDNEKKLGPNRGCDGNFEGYFTIMAWIYRNSHDLFTIHTRFFVLSSHRYRRPFERMHLTWMQQHHPPHDRKAIYEVNHNIVDRAQGQPNSFFSFRTSMTKRGTGCIDTK